MSAHPETAPGAFVSPQASVGADASIAPGAVVHARVELGPGVQIGSGSVIYPDCSVAEDCTIEDNVVLGKRPRLRRGSRASGGEPGLLVLERGATVCAGAVVYAGARIGEGVIVGDQAHVRENALIGADSVLGRGASVEFGASIGSRVLIQSDAYLTAGSVIEDDVFVGPGVTTTNDDTMGRHGPQEPLRGPTLKRACRIGGGVVLAPGVTVGEEAFIAAGAVVVADVGVREVVMGVPGRAVREVPEEDLFERWR